METREQCPDCGGEVTDGTIGNSCTCNPMKTCATVAEMRRNIGNAELAASIDRALAYTGGPVALDLPHPPPGSSREQFRAEQADLAIAAEGAQLLDFVDNALQQMTHGERMAVVIVVTPVGRGGRAHVLSNVENPAARDILMRSADYLRDRAGPTPQPEEPNLNGG